MTSATQHVFIAVAVLAVVMAVAVLLMPRAVEVVGAAQAAVEPAELA